jgi:monofunctional biosynthetic peptidoglycan transglycosylase
MYLILITILAFNSSVLSIDFGAEKDGRNWQIINDRVMGGISTGQAGLDDNSLLFVGRLSFENNGGFASLRSNRMRLDLSNANFVEIKYRLNGINFAFMFEQYARFWQPYYSYPLPTTDGEWVTKIIPVESLLETRMSDYTGQYFDKDSSRPFFRIGFISDDKKEERFELEIDYISIY